jgi:hypothetical protein
MSQDRNGSFNPGERVRVHQPTANELIKQRIYKVAKLVEQFDLLQLEWVDAPKGSKERYLWVLKDFVRKV